MRRPVALLTGPRRAALSSVSALSRVPEAVSGCHAPLEDPSERALGRGLRWRINRLRCMTPAELPYRIARSVAAHVEPIWPLRARVPPADREPSPGSWVYLPDDLDPGRYASAADRIVAGTFDIFAVSCTSGAAPPDWNRDPKTGVEAPLVWGKRLDYRDRGRVGEIKYLWELNRHLHLVTLAQGYALTRDPKYLRVLGQHVTSWIGACPVGRGANWCSALEVAIRLINWSIAWQLVGGAGSPLFAGSEGLQFRQRWLDSVYQQARFVRGYFSRYSSANNHLIGEAAGLYIAGLTWPCWPGLRRWREAARRILEREMLAQSSADGVNLEQAVCYQQFVLDFLLLALLAGSAAGEPFSAAYRQRIAAMLEFLASIMDAGGHVPMIGDADDGAVTRLAQGAGFCPFRSLLASGAVLFENGALKHKAGELDDKTRWLFGSPAREVFDRLPTQRSPLPTRRAFAGGYYILGCDFEGRDEVRVVADAGPLGYGTIAAHGHADALSFTLSFGGLPFLIDPGTYLYHGGGRWRAYFRGTSAHNTVRIDGLDQSEPGGDFMWVRKARAGCDAVQVADEVETLDLWHAGYLRLPDPVLHRRRLIFEKAVRRLVIEDRLQMSAVHDVELFFHCAAACSVEPAASGFAIRRGRWTLVLQPPPNPQGAARLYRASTHPICGWSSRRYDQREPSTTIAWQARLQGSVLVRTELVCRLDYACGSNGARRSDYAPGS